MNRGIVKGPLVGYSESELVSREQKENCNMKKVLNDMSNNLNIDNNDKGNNVKDSNYKHTRDFSKEKIQNIGIRDLNQDESNLSAN